MKIPSSHSTVLSLSCAFFIRCSLIMFLLTSFTVISSSAQVELIKDINTLKDPFELEYSKAVDCNGILYFYSKNELWRTNGTSSGTTLVKQYRDLGDMISFSGAVYFYAAQEGQGMELWRTAGTSESTVLLKDIRPGYASSSFDPKFAVSGQYLFFVANNGTNGWELWRTDGTPGGTVMVKDIVRTRGSSNPAFLTDVNGILYFSANDGINGYELWKSDGTEAGTVMVKDIRVGKSSFPRLITNVDGVVYFTADDGIAGRELWKSDGTAGGTELVKDLNPGLRATPYRNFTSVNNTLFFSANDRIHGEELWKSDGTATGTVMVKDLFPKPTTKLHPGVVALGPALLNFASVNGKLYFTAYGADGYYFWKSDGTEAGTVPLMIANPIGGGPVTAFFTSYKGSVFFFNGGGEYPDTYSFSLMKEDASGKITTIATYFLDGFYDSRTPFLVESSNLLYLTGRPTPDRGYALFRTGGTAASTKLVADTYIDVGHSSDPTDFVKMGNILYFTASDETDGTNLWKTDGTNTGTVQLTEMHNVSHLTNVNGQLFFAGAATGDREDPWAIYKTDGTPGGASKVCLEFPGTPQTFTKVNNKLFATWGSNYFMTSDGWGCSVLAVTPSVQEVFPFGKFLYFKGTENVHGDELWQTNGASGRTIMVKDINRAGGSDIQHFTALNGVVYFSADDGVRGHELWRSQGTPGSTFMVRDLRTKDSDLTESDIYDVVTAGDHVYVFGLDENDQHAIWKSDGTVANTLKIANIPPMHGRAMVSNTRLYFVTTSPDGYHLWKSDGTTESTQQLAALNIGNTTYRNSYVTIGDTFYGNFYSEYLWTSDGTPCGTFAITAVSGSPSPIEFLGDELIFAADDDIVGRELYKINLTGLTESPCAGASQLFATEGNAARIGTYPNPFHDSFSLEIAGDRLEEYSIQIVDLANNVYHVQSKLQYNQAHLLGTGLPKGVYVLRIQDKDGVSVHKIIKH